MEEFICKQFTNMFVVSYNSEYLIYLDIHLSLPA